MRTHVNGFRTRLWTQWRRSTQAAVLGGVLIGSLAGRVAARSDTSSAEGTAATAEVLSSLASPLAEIRRRAQGQLSQIIGQDGVREFLCARLPREPWRVQRLLVEILAQDGHPSSLTAVLTLLLSGDAQAAPVVLRSLAVSETASTWLNAQRVADPEGFLQLDFVAREAGPPPISETGAARMADLAGLLARAEAERLFLSRKSVTGPTGYYRGLYSVLARPDLRRTSLEVVTGVALDEALPTPGLYPGGTYSFLRPPPAEMWELRDMAMHAIAELWRPPDQDILERLDAGRMALEADVLQGRRRLESIWRRARFHLDEQTFRDDLMELGDDLVQLSSVVVCLVLMDPQHYESVLDEFLESVDRDWQWPVRPLHLEGLAAGVLIQVGRFREAVRAYERELVSMMGAEPTIYYNLACAYASWSITSGVPPEEALQLRERAMRAIERSVALGWRDLGWLEQDGDLDPLRQDPRFDQLIAFIRADLELGPAPGPQEDRKGGEGAPTPDTPDPPR